MTSREFFFLVSNMRNAQKNYFATRSPERLRAARKLENEVDAEIRRVKNILTRPDSDTNQNLRLKASSTELRP